jgi:hypothetical protein
MRVRVPRSSLSEGFTAKRITAETQRTRRRKRRGWRIENGGS